MLHFSAFYDQGLCLVSNASGGIWTVDPDYLLIQRQTGAHILKQFARIYTDGQGDEVDLLCPKLGVVVEGQFSHSLFAEPGLAGYDGFVH